MTQRAMTPASYQQVLAAVRSRVAEDTDPGRRFYQAHGMTQNIAGRLGVEVSEQGSDWARRVRAAFNGQILRALNQLADEGRLIKVGKGQKGPAGSKPYGGVPQFYTQDGWRAADEAHKAHRAAVAELDRRWARASERLAGLGLAASRSRGRESVYIPLADLETLLDRHDADGGYV